MSPDTEALAQFYAAVNRNDMQAITKDFDPAIVRVEPEGFPTAGTYRGIAEVQAHVAKGRGTWAEGTCEPEKFLTNGDKVVVYLHARVRLRDSTEWVGGRFADGFVFRNGKIIEYLSFGERADALEWAGIEPEQALQRIGQEAGIEPARSAHAAERVDAGGRAAVRRSFGLPIGVSRIVDLPRAPTEREWAQLISEFRTTFGAHGHTTIAGGLRDWSHGNLHISVEPTAHGEQLRLSDLKDDAVAINGLGYLLGAMGLLVAAVVAADGQPKKALMAFGVFGGLGLFAFFAALLVRTPLWARERERQMQEIAERAVRLLSKNNA